MFIYSLFAILSFGSFFTLLWLLLFDVFVLTAATFLGLTLFAILSVLALGLSTKGDSNDSRNVSRS